MYASEMVIKCFWSFKIHSESTTKPMKIIRYQFWNVPVSMAQKCNTLQPKEFIEGKKKKKIHYKVSMDWIDANAEAKS